MPAEIMRRDMQQIEDWPADEPDVCALLSEEALAKGWSRPEEDIAWAWLQLLAGADRKDEQR